MACVTDVILAFVGLDGDAGGLLGVTGAPKHLADACGTMILARTISMGLGSGRRTSSCVVSLRREGFYVVRCSVASDFSEKPRRARSGASKEGVNRRSRNNLVKRRRQALTSLGKGTPWLA